MVATSQVGHAALAGIVGLGFGYLPGDENVSTRGDGFFKIPLRSSSAPRYFFNSFMRWSDQGYRSF